MDEIKKEIKDLNILKNNLQSQIVMYENKQKELRCKLYRMCKHKFVKADCIYGELYCVNCNLPPRYCKTE